MIKRIKAISIAYRMAMLLSLWIWTPFVYAQEGSGIETSPGTIKQHNERIDSQRLRDVFIQLEKKYNVQFAINDQLIEDKYVVGPTSYDKDVDKVLDNILSPFNLTYKKIKGYYVILSKSDESNFVEANMIDYEPITQKREPESRSAPIRTTKPVTIHNKLTLQQLQASGKVVSSKEDFPLPGVSVSVKGGTATTVTDINGNYKINVPDEQANLVFSYVGYIAREIPLNGTLQMNVALQEDVRLLRDVLITVPYGTQTRESFTGSAVTVSSESVSDRPRESFQSSLQGNVAGLQVMASTGQPGSVPNLRIRGIGSTDNAGNSSPLYVIDGVPVLAQGAAGLASASNTMAGINPNDIESVTVLKDASATSIYGSQGANGVIMITTKSGAEGKTKINASVQYGINQMSNSSRSMPLTTAEMSQLLIEGVINSTINDELTAITSPEAAYEYLITEGLNPDVNTNWFDVITQTGKYSQYNVSASGGDAKTTYFMSGGYYKRDAVTKGQDYERKSARLSLNHKATDKLSYGGRLSLSRQELSTIKAAGSGQNPMRSLYRLVPWLAPYNADGTYNPAVAYNPELLRHENVYKTKISQLIGNVNMEYKITDYLSLESRAAMDYNFSDDFEFWSPLWVDGRGVNGRGMQYDLTWDNWSVNNLLKYRTQLNDFGINATLGQEASKRNQKVVSSQATNYSAEDLYNLASASTPFVAYTAENHATLTSYFLNTSFNYQRKYYLNATGRRDGSSRFGKNVKYGNFWSVGAAWNIHEEAFVQSIDFINLIKLRASYGQSGSQTGAYYGHMGYYTTNKYNGQPGFGMAQMESGDLSWEKNTPFDIGLEFSVLNNRLSGTIDWYTRTTSDLFMDMPISHTNGVDDVRFNVGSMKNTGIEVALNSDNIRPTQEGGFAWQTNFNISTQKNKVLKLSGENRVVESYYVREIGEDYYQYYLRGYAGVERTTGEPLWYTNGDRTATTTNINEAAAFKQKDKTGLAKFYGGLTNSFSYKGIHLSTLIYFNVGNYIYDIWGQYSQTDGSAGLDAYGLMSRMLYENHWQKPGDVAAYPRIVYRGRQSGLPGQHSTRFLYNGTYIRLRDVKLSYDLPLQKMNIKMSNAQIYLQANNLYTWIYDDLLPYDPEVGVGGLMNSNLPISRQFILGVNLTF